MIGLGTTLVHDSSAPAFLQRSAETNRAKQSSSALNKSPSGSRAARKTAPSLPPPRTHSPQKDDEEDVRKISQDVLGFLEEPVSAKETGDTDDE